MALGLGDPTGPCFRAQCLYVSFFSHLPTAPGQPIPPGSLLLKPSRRRVGPIPVRPTHALLCSLAPALFSPDFPLARGELAGFARAGHETPRAHDLLLPR